MGAKDYADLIWSWRYIHFICVFDILAQGEKAYDQWGEDLYSCRLSEFQKTSLITSAGTHLLITC